MISAVKNQKGGETHKSQSAFKTLLINILECEGDFTKMNPKFTRPIKCAVKETGPNFLLHDGTYYIGAYFTPEAYAKYY
jgi:hypothetical protein